MAIGSYLFYVQHNFPDIQLNDRREWNYESAALHSSSLFDMPPLSPTSPTLAMAGFMDKVLLVVDAGKTKRDVIKRGYQDLVNSRADVSTILNKTRENLPSWLQA